MSNRDLFSSCIELLRKATDAHQQLSALRSSLENAADDVVREHMILGIASLEEVVACQDRIPEAIAILEKGELGKAMDEVKGLLFELSDAYLDGLSENTSEKLILQMLGPFANTTAGKYYKAAGDLDQLLHPEAYAD